jgi:hypothetical protein
MSQQGPIIVVATSGRPPFASALDESGLFPIVDAGWTDAPRAVAEVEPAAVLVACSRVEGPELDVLAKQLASRRPYVPLIAINPETNLPENAIPFSHADGNFDRLMTRLRAALRVRTLHSAVMRRMQDEAPPIAELADIDPARDATVLLIGRGGSYPALSVSLGERIGVVGALSIEAAAKHLSVRDIDGIVLSDGFTTRVMDAFLTVIAENARLRNLPIVLTSNSLGPLYPLSNLEIISGEPELVAANALPLIRQHAFEAYLSRTLRSIEAGGLLDPRTGLLTPAAFDRDFGTAVRQALSRGGGLSVARFAFDPDHARAHLDGARILSRLMRQMDFGAAQPDGSVIVVFSETDLRTSHMIARRLCSVMRHTTHGKRDLRSEPAVTIASLAPGDTPQSVLSRLYQETRRVAS